MITAHANRGDTCLKGLCSLHSLLCPDTGLINPRERTLILVPAHMAHQIPPPLLLIATFGQKHLDLSCYAGGIKHNEHNWFWHLMDSKTKNSANIQGIMYM